MAETHNVRLVLRHLMMDRRGCEIYIRPLSRYPRLLEKLQARKWMPYCEIAEYVRGLGETAIGCATRRPLSCARRVRWADIYDMPISIPLDKTFLVVILNPLRPRERAYLRVKKANAGEIRTKASYIVLSAAVRSYVHENGHHELNPSNTRQRIAPGDLLITIAEHP